MEKSVQRYDNVFRYPNFGVCKSEWFRFLLFVGWVFLGKEVVTRVFGQIKYLGYVHPVAVVELVAVGVTITAMLEPAVDEGVEAWDADVRLKGGVEGLGELGFWNALHRRFRIFCGGGVCSTGSDKRASPWCRRV